LVLPTFNVRRSKGDANNALMESSPQTPTSSLTTEARRAPAISPRFTLVVVVALFCVAAFGLSWWRWWTYQYGTFDLAFYVQSLWLAIHGKWNVSLLGVPVLGNHAEPIVFLLAPFFAIFRHPMLFVAAQVLALATMPFTAWRIARKLEIAPWASAALASVTLLAPATGFVAVHEFHPESFAAPLLLLLYEARLAERLGRSWLWFLAAVGCKENVALLLIGWCVVQAICERRKTLAWQLRWNVAPALVAVLWLALYAGWLSPHLNGGRVDYGNLYAPLGDSGGDIVAKILEEPHRIFGALRQSVTGGDLVWAMFLSFAFLPGLRPRWIVIAAPLFLQHLLSSRSSEWTMHYHYAAPLIPLFWIASAEAMQRHRLHAATAWAAVVFCLGLQIFDGPWQRVGNDWRTMDLVLWNREWKARIVGEIAADQSLRVSAGIPYLSHLAMRDELYSLHFVIKGFKTLSTARDDPTYTADAVLIDYGDEQTFSMWAGYYHPEGQRGQVRLPSSDELLNSFLGRSEWTETSMNALTLLRATKSPATEAFPETNGPVIDPHSTLLRANISPIGEAVLGLHLEWRFSAPRTRIPWLVLNLDGGTAKYPLLLGMCAPQTLSGEVAEDRKILLPPSVPPGSYRVSGVFFDKIDALWRPNQNSVLQVVPIGEVKVGGSGKQPSQ
jgi:uncharacterized membrane protein